MNEIKAISDKLAIIGADVAAASVRLAELAEASTPGAPSLIIDRYVLPVSDEPGEWYFASMHTPPAHYGLDINLRKYPRGDVELDYPVLATCAGLVIFAGQARGTSWGNLIVTMSLDDAGPIYWRYGHAREVMVARGDYVGAGRQIGTIGKGYNDRYYAHLHLDCARGLQGPGEWGTKTWNGWTRSKCGRQRDIVGSGEEGNMNTLTRNQSADLVEGIAGAIIARAPESIKAIKAQGAIVYLAENFEVDGIHKDHFGWLVSRLLIPGALSLIDDFAADIRAMGDSVDAPWRD